jgi:hypothetical protein
LPGGRYHNFKDFMNFTALPISNFLSGNWFFARSSHRPQS